VSDRIKFVLRVVGSRVESCPDSAFDDSELAQSQRVQVFAIDVVRSVECQGFAEPHQLVGVAGHGR